MTSIDEKVVSLKFDDSDFQSGVGRVSKTLEDLKKNLTFKDTSKSFEDVSKAANSIKFDGLTNNLADVQKNVAKISTNGQKDFEQLGDSATKSLGQVSKAADNVDLSSVEKTAGKMETPARATAGAYRSSTYRRSSPPTTGRRTTCTMDVAISANVTEMDSPARRTIHAGITTGAATVVTVVIVTDSATSQRPR